jgi:hypothetical protein
MRVAVPLILILAVAAPAAAQVPLSLQLDAERRAEESMARQRSIALENELQAMDARMRNDQAVRDLESKRYRIELARPVYTDAAPAPKPQAGPYASIPDGRLAASNERVRAASQSRR